MRWNVQVRVRIDSAISRTREQRAQLHEALSMALIGDGEDNLIYIFAKLRVGYRMPKGETPGQGEE